MSIFSTPMELLEPSRMNSLLHLLIIRFEMDTLKTRIMEMGTYQHIELGQLTHDQITKGDLPNGN